MVRLSQDYDSQRLNQLEIKSPRLLLRRINDADFEAQLEQERDPRIMRFIREVPSLEHAKERVRGFIAPWSGKEMDWLCFTIAAAGVDGFDTGAVLGAVVFRLTDQRLGIGEFGYRVNVSCQGKGIGYEASQALVDAIFRETPLHKIVAKCVAVNVPSWRIMEKVGMQREGVLRDEADADGKREDLLVYGLLRREWKQTL